MLPISGEARSTNLQTSNADDTSVHVVVNGTDIPTNLLKAVAAVVATRLNDADNMLPPMVILEYRDGQGLCVELVLRSWALRSSHSPVSPTGEPSRRAPSGSSSWIQKFVTVVTFLPGDPFP